MVPGEGLSIRVTSIQRSQGEWTLVWCLGFVLLLWLSKGGYWMAITIRWLLPQPPDLWTNKSSICIYRCLEGFFPYSVALCSGEFGISSQVL